ncbi:MAG: hypothetical protein ACRCUY_02170 [Thermoguttaceae bacterium]
MPILNERNCIAALGFIWRAVDVSRRVESPSERPNDVEKMRSQLLFALRLKT